MNIVTIHQYDFPFLWAPNSSFISNLVKIMKDVIPRIINVRNRKSLQEALIILSDFNLDKNIELAAEDLRMAAREIGKITGKIEVDNILEVIFSRFCIGK